MSKKTLGQISLENWEKKSESRDPIEIERELHKDYEKNVIMTIADGKAYLDKINSERNEFFVEVATKKEIIFGQRALSHKFFFKMSCPTPFYDQTVYRCERKGDIVNLLWVVPDKETSLLMWSNRLAVPTNEYALLDFVLKFYDGSLLKLAKEINGEEDKPGLILN